MNEISNQLKQLLEFGIINIDKPSGPTSFNISDQVRGALKSLGVRKTSHFGTLDPKVTGVLPIALNRACKLTGYFIGHDKEYIGIMRMHEEIPIKKIQEVINSKFKGIIIQKPPVKSRVKRQEREREIKSFELLEQYGKDILFRTTVQGGTYIRKLIDDLGRELNIGAHMLELRRIRAGLFSEPSVNMYDFEKAIEEAKKGNEKPLKKIITPAEIIKKIHPEVQVKETAVKKLLTGKQILSEDLKKKVKFDKNEVISVFSGERFIGMYEVLNDKYGFAKPKFVMQEIRG